MYLYKRRYKLHNKNNKIFKIVSLFTGNVAVWFELTLKDFINNRESDRDFNTVKLFLFYRNFEKKFLNMYGNPDEKRLIA